MDSQNLKNLLQKRDLKLVDLARRLGVDKATVSRWALKGVPADRIEDVSGASGIPAHELRPDLAQIFSPTPEAAP